MICKYKYKYSLQLCFTYRELNNHLLQNSILLFVSKGHVQFYFDTCLKEVFIEFCPPLNQLYDCITCFTMFYDINGYTYILRVSNSYLLLNLIYACLLWCKWIVFTNTTRNMKTHLDFIRHKRG